MKRDKMIRCPALHTIKMPQTHSLSSQTGNTNLTIEDSLQTFLLCSPEINIKPLQLKNWIRPRAFPSLYPLVCWQAALNSFLTRRDQMMIDLEKEKNSLLLPLHMVRSTE